MSQVQALVNDFINKLDIAIAEQVQDTIANAFTRRGPGRPRKNGVVLTAVAQKTVSRRKRQKPQLCPVPGCKNRAAPVYNMVCAKHKDVPKAKIKKYRAKRAAAAAKK